MKKFWLSSYPASVTHEINPDEYFSIPDLFEYAVKKFSTHPAVHNLGITLSYEELNKKATAFAAYLQQCLGLQKGDRLGIMLPNSIQYIVAMLGALRAGLILVNINPLYTARELIHQVNDAGVHTLVVLENFAHTVQEALPNMQLDTIIISKINDFFPSLKKIVTNFVLKYIKKSVPNYTFEAIAFSEVLKKGSLAKFIKLSLDRNDIAFLQYTGGTTGVSKGAMLTHRNILANVAQAYAWMAHGGIEEGKEIMITILPLYHVLALMGNCFAFMKVGFLNILITDGKNIAGLIQELAKHRFTLITGISTLFKALLAHRSFRKLDFSSLKIALSGGMSVHRAVAEEWYEVTKVPLLEGYGLTEASPVVTCNPLTIEKHTGSIGLPLPSTEIKIMDAHEKELGTGEAGELWVRGPQVMQGYWERPLETREVLTEDGWLKTGDIAEIDERGFLRIVDRKKDLIIVSGYNVYPNEVEEAISEHPDVLEVAVIGESSEKTGEMIRAFVVRKTPSLDRANLVSFCRERLTWYKIPRRIEFCDQLPKSNVGKILRRVLREERFRNKQVH